ncbi:MAG: ABC transporter ATP-binding protein/permease [Clostridia bacterium]|nr:ABC transporter ATP-binding protein/permease [Clostridia bacterium]
MLEVRNISKTYVTGDLTQVALDNVSLTLRDNEFVAILGPSGSGKTTLLNVIGGLDRYDSGDLVIDGVSTKEYKDKDWDSYRNHTVGFVFQNYNLIAHQSVLSNVELALTISDVPASERKARAREALEKVGLGDQIHKKPNQLSGGQMQRVAIARALVNDPDIILADEPTGALDSKTSVQIMDLLKEVAKDRLVIMVTHNPDLANEYATRIINLKDGQIISDSMPVEAGEQETVHEKPPKTSLGFLTALGLSINNLMTKKGRTFLTSFAGSVGIIGIALILALSNGVNDYIRGIEGQMLGSYPVQLTQSSFDLESVMNTDEGGGDLFGTGSSSSDSGEEERTTRRSRKDAKEDAAKADGFESYNMVAGSLSATEELLKTNDLKTFKKYLEANMGKLKGDITAVEYNYNLTPQVFRNDKKNGLVKVSPASLSVQDVTGVDYSELFGDFGSNFGGLSSTWTQLVSNRELREQQFELVEGEWPSSKNEVALILNSNNHVSDYVLYTIGMLDISDMNKMVEKAKAGKKVEDETHKFDYNDAIGLKFRAFAPAELYRKSGDVYVDKSEDSKFVSSKLKDGDGVELTITCVLRADEDSNVSSGVGYDASLTSYLLDTTAETGVVKAQLKNKKTNVLTGKKFSDEQKASQENNILFSQGLFPMGTALVNETPSVEPLGFYQEKVDPTDVAFLLPDNAPGAKLITDIEDFLFQTLTDLFLKLFQDLVPKDMVGKLVQRYLDSLTDEQKAQIAQQFMGSFTQADLEQLVKDYASQMSEEDMANIIKQVMGSLSQKDIENMVRQYVGSMSEQDIQNMIAAAMGDMSEEDLARMVQGYLGSMDQAQIQKMLQDYILQNQDMIAEAIRSMMSDEDLEALVAQFTGASVNTYEGVLQKLGYITKDEPSMISIYPSNFEGKEAIVKFIDEYNAQIKDDSEKVTYTDLIATVTSSITKIVDTISYVLIAFVAISLIVSSIMIAIITYISVLERTREIGVLRAIGSSKNDISKIFNAETFIEGLFSGILGIVVTLLLCIPANAIARQHVDIERVATLPFRYALVLILISVILTFIAGFIPSRIAAKKDPVAALRSE